MFFYIIIENGGQINVYILSSSCMLTSKANDNNYGTGRRIC